MMNDELDLKIRSLVTELIDAAPPAPPLPTGESVRRRRRHRRAVLASVTLSVAVVVAAGAATLPRFFATGPGITRLFVRTTNTGLTIRLYKIAPPAASVTNLEAGLSTSSAIGLLDSIDVSPLAGPDGIYVASATVFGTGSHGGMATIVWAGSRIARVRVHFSSGATDSMRPVDGWAVLGKVGTRPGGVVTGLDAFGRKVASAAIPKPTLSGEGFRGESTPTFTRVTNQGIVVIGHMVNGGPSSPGWLYPYLADGAAVQLGLEGIPFCRPVNPTAVDVGLVVEGVSEGEPMTVIVVHAGSAISRVSIQYSNGAHDSMKLVAGQGVLANVGTIGPKGNILTLKKSTVEGFSGTGKLLRRFSYFGNSSPYHGCAYSH